MYAIFIDMVHESQIPPILISLNPEDWDVLANLNLFQLYGNLHLALKRHTVIVLGYQECSVHFTWISLIVFASFLYLRNYLLFSRTRSADLLSITFLDTDSRLQIVSQNTSQSSGLREISIGGIWDS